MNLFFIFLWSLLSFLIDGKPKNIFFNNQKCLGSIYVDTSANPLISDGSSIKPYNNLTVALLNGNLINVGEIIIISNDIIFDLVQDLQINVTSIVRALVSSQINLNSGVVSVKDNLTFQNIMFTRDSVHINSNAFFLMINATLSFLVFLIIFLFLFFMGSIF